MEQKYYYKIKNDELAIAIKRHNSLQCEIGQGITDQKTIDILDLLSKNIALVKSKFECAKCHAENKRLQFHHLIMTCYKEIMPLNIYLMIRHNYKTIVVLCKDCHQSYHGKIDKHEDINFISETRTAQVIRDYFEKTNY